MSENISDDILAKVKKQSNFLGARIGHATKNYFKGFYCFCDECSILSCNNLQLYFSQYVVSYVMLSDMGPNSFSDLTSA